MPAKKSAKATRVHAPAEVIPGAMGGVITKIGPHAFEHGPPAMPGLDVHDDHIALRTALERLREHAPDAAAADPALLAETLASWLTQSARVLRANVASTEERFRYERAIRSAWSAFRDGRNVEANKADAVIDRIESSLALLKSGELKSVAECAAYVARTLSYSWPDASRALSLEPWVPWPALIQPSPDLVAAIDAGAHPKKRGESRPSFDEALATLLAKTKLANRTAASIATSRSKAKRARRNV